ncbi:MAG: tRNA threonylcarbamoyladenosine dehydratase [bacterium]|nr:tRNA threonylcarbamoyladenosine dehydratase [bacterium]
MSEQFVRTELLLGSEAMNKLNNSRVIVFGVGGVGGFVVEALARTGIGTIDIVDDDNVSVSNINRQIIATHSSIGRAKVDVMRERILDINPNCKVNVHQCFFTPETADQFNFADYDYVVDAIDTVTGKLELVVRANETHTPIICSMGAGNKLDPTRFEITDINKTSVCPLAKVMRKELKNRGIKKLKVVYSKEQPLKPIQDEAIKSKEKPAATPLATRSNTAKRQTPGSTAFVPSVVGLILASEVVKDLTSK